MKHLEEFIQRRINVTEISPKKWAISFPMYKVGYGMQHGGMYDVYLLSVNNEFYLSDGGTTLAELDKIFELNEPDVLKNLVAILKQYNCNCIEIEKSLELGYVPSNIPLEKSVTIPCSPDNIHIKMGYLLQAMSFMLNMKIFYV